MFLSCLSLDYTAVEAPGRAHPGHSHDYSQATKPRHALRHEPTAADADAAMSREGDHAHHATLICVFMQRMADPPDCGLRIRTCQFIPGDDTNGQAARSNAASNQRIHASPGTTKLYPATRLGRRSRAMASRRRPRLAISAGSL